MFDIGFWELILIAGIALLVVGPERMPIVLGNVGRWVGKARAYINAVRGDIERQVASAEQAAKENEALKTLQETAVSIGNDAKGARGAMQDTANAFKNPVGALTGAAVAKTSGGHAAENQTATNTASTGVDPQQEMLPTSAATTAVASENVTTEQLPPPPVLPESLADTATDSDLESESLAEASTVEKAKAQRGGS